MFIGLNETVIGASHVDSGTVCQDYSDFKVTDKYAVAVVAMDMEVRNISVVIMAQKLPLKYQ